MTIRWPGGGVESIPDLPTSGHYVVVQGSGKALPFNVPPGAQGLPPPVTEPAPASEAIRTVFAHRYPMLPLEENRDLLAELGGRPLLICLWASWCQPCLAELKSLADQEKRDRGGGARDPRALCGCSDRGDGRRSGLGQPPS